MLKTPEEFLKEIKQTFEEAKKEWVDHLSGENIMMTIYYQEKNDAEIPKKIEKVYLPWTNEALARDNLAGWKEFYEKWNKWNGDLNISENEYDGTKDLSLADLRVFLENDKYDGDKDLCGRLDDLRVFLENYEIASYIKKLQNALQTVGIDPADENLNEKAEELKKVQADLTDLGIDKSKVKETIEKERNEYKAKDEWLIDNYLGENTWKEIEIETKIEVKKN